MYVSAPHRSTNGSTIVTTAVQVRAGGSLYLTPQEALLNADILNQSTTKNAGSTVRADMMSGIVSYHNYDNTQYSCQYRTWKSSGRVKTVQKQGLYYASLNNLLFPGFVGFFGTGVDDYLADISPSGTSLSPQAIYNRSVMVNVSNRAKAECLNKASQSKLDLSEALVGLVPTVRMVASSVSKLLLAWNATRKGNFLLAFQQLGILPKKSMSKYPEDIASFWLEIQYGWLPLLSDIFNGVDLVNTLLKSDGEHKNQFTVVRRLTEQLYMRSPVAEASSWLDLTSSTSGQCSVEVRYRFRVSDPNIAFLSSLGLTNPFYTVWVAVPFSFVVDWVLPVSDWLQALSAPLGLQFVSGYQTLKSWGLAQVSASRRNTGAYVKIMEVGNTTAICEGAYMIRTKFSSWPIAVPYIRFPFNSDRRVANAIALITTSRKFR